MTSDLPVHDDGQVRVFHGDSLHVLAGMEDNSVDAVLTDPPYGLSAPPDMATVLRHWLDDTVYNHPGTGFMGAAWDAFVPGPALWRELLRVVKPGGYAAVFAGTRTLDLMGLSLRLGGWQVRDVLSWTFAQGFPKSTAADKALEKNGSPAETVERFRDYGTALKPAHEPVLLVRKPLDGTIADTLAAHGTGALNIGASRIAAGGEVFGGGAKATSGFVSGYERGAGFVASATGRFPSNVLLTHGPGCVLLGLERDEAPSGAEPHVASVERWSCQPDGCPAAELDRQSGTRSSGKPGIKRGGNNGAAYGKESRPPGTQMPGFGDSGGASRFFKTLPFAYQSKAGSEERVEVWIRDCGHGPDPHDPSTPPAQAASFGPRTCDYCGKDWQPYEHPSVKPGRDEGPLGGVMAYLLRLVAPEGGVVIDPFAGTGTTGVVAQREGFPAVLLEQNPAHVQMILKRLGEPIQQGLFGL